MTILQLFLIFPNSSMGEELPIILIRIILILKILIIIYYIIIGRLNEVQIME